MNYLRTLALLMVFLVHVKGQNRCYSMWGNGCDPKDTQCCSSDCVPLLEPFCSSCEGDSPLCICKTGKCVAADPGDYYTITHPGGGGENSEIGLLLGRDAHGHRFATVANVTNGGGSEGSSKNNTEINKGLSNTMNKMWNILFLIFFLLFGLVSLANLLIWCLANKEASEGTEIQERHADKYGGRLRLPMSREIPTIMVERMDFGEPEVPVGRSKFYV